MAFYVSDSNYMRLRYYTVEQRTTFTEVMEDVAVALLDHSYRCKEANCNCEFIIRSTLSDAAPSCPCCGSKRIERASKF